MFKYPAGFFGVCSIACHACHTCQGGLGFPVSKACQLLIFMFQRADLLTWLANVPKGAPIFQLPLPKGVPIFQMFFKIIF